eukprot:CAMPEP_0201913748 /NCGR_PEP_ID=MMETSP0903-20130614/4117_1 /ASSEMBLY_ACC=CAM_ASM_000552 /TAXON_ID=420261 /ORGANISM="Thalassiosira antarctica, Strain CCMP982" /LENGTH=422 /DNA_ID=CAMNT_0048449007 /DNA_START=10 /DNA_END=1281 /DNA_ORIENTATION=-
MGGFLELVGTFAGRSEEGQPKVAPCNELFDEEEGKRELVVEETSTSTTATATKSKNPSANHELHPLMNPGANKNKKPSEDGSLIQLIMLNLDERCSVKLLLRIWGPRLEFVVRLMLVATFLDDSFRMAMHFTEHIEQVGQGACLKWLGAASPIIATVMLGIGLLAQSIGSICLLALLQSDVATMALVGWAIAQPMLYSQISNLEFMSESLSLIGGLLMLRVHLLSKHQATSISSSPPSNNNNGPRTTSAITQLIGRLLLPTAYLYHAGLFLFSAVTLDETNNLATYLSSLSMFVINTAALVALVIGSILVATGLKSRTVALFLALINLGFVLYQHPFFRFVHRTGGEWTVDEDYMWMLNVALSKDVTPSDFDPWQIYDLHRYYFFLGLSTSGALLLLAQFGPGEIAMQKDEVLLPVVARARD